MRDTLRALWVVLLLVLVGFARARGGQTPVPSSSLFAVQKLADRLYVMSPVGPDASNMGGNVAVYISDEGVAERR